MDSETYKKQLSQVQQQLAVCTCEREKSELHELERNLKELIELNDAEEVISGVAAADDLEEQYNLFKAELASDQKIENNENIVEDQDQLQNDLKSLEGTKCQAPFLHAWSDEPVYYNALVFKCGDVSSSEVKVIVMFTHPTQLSMKPCPFFLEGDCKFTSEKCKFSHGESVALESLKEFKEPDYSGLASGSRVLVMQSDGLWHFGILASILNEHCNIKLDSTSKEIETDLVSVYPLDNEKVLDDLDTEGSEGEEEDGRINLEPWKPSSNALGSWEEFTKGIGSRLMAKMGYIHGCGLGVNGDGRVEPVPAVVYPPRKSLDHCMMLKEHASGGDNMFKAERKMRIKERKQKEQLARAYQRQKEQTDVFTFLNNQIGSRTQPDPIVREHPSTSNELSSIAKKRLAISSFHVAEDEKKIRKEKKSLTDALRRHSSDSKIYSSIKEKIKACDEKLSLCEKSERAISNELKQRRNREKLAIF